MHYMELGGLTVGYRLHDPYTPRWFEWHMRDGDVMTDHVIELSESLLEMRRPLFYPGTAESYMEYRTLVEPTGRVLAEHNRFIFHSVAFAWNGYAWLVFAPSGTGKTTQYLNWKRLWPHEVKLLCGDMPVIMYRPDGNVWVCPSPWNGSERMGFENRESKPLGGIVWLIQDTTNHIERLDMNCYVRNIWHSFIGQADTERQITSRAAFMDRLFRQYPAWQFFNCGDHASTELMRQTFEHCLREGHAL